VSDVLSRDVGAVRVLTLNRPERRNAFTPSGYRDLRAALKRADDESDIKVILIEGGKQAFSAGADLNYLHDHADVEVMKREFDGLLATLTRLSKPLIAAAAGAAVGFGATLFLHCDVVFLASNARLRFPFVELGTAPEAGSSWLLPNAVGPQRAMELVLSARWLTAAEAVEIGLAARTVDNNEVGEVALELAQRIAESPAGAAIAAKALLRAACQHPIEEAVKREYATAQALADTRAAPMEYNDALRCGPNSPP
jgi:enoyl-CoA hydratase/carnithine racemase